MSVHSGRMLLTLHPALAGIPHATPVRGNPDDGEIDSVLQGGVQSALGPSTLQRVPDYPAVYHRHFLPSNLQIAICIVWSRSVHRLLAYYAMQSLSSSTFERPRVALAFTSRGPSPRIQRRRLATIKAHGGREGQQDNGVDARPGAPELQITILGLDALGRSTAACIEG